MEEEEEEEVQGQLKENQKGAGGKVLLSCSFMISIIIMIRIIIMRNVFPLMVTMLGISHLLRRAPEPDIAMIMMIMT